MKPLPNEKTFVLDEERLKNTNKPNEPIEVNRERYEELVKAEERLRTLEAALKSLDFYDRDFELFKKIFNLNEVNKK